VQVTSDGVAVGELIAAVKASVRRAGVSRASDAPDLQVASVQLTLRVVASRTGGGEVSFRVPVLGMALAAGATVTHQDTHTIDLTLVPPAGRPGFEVRGGEVEEVLVEAIGTIRGTLAAAAAGPDPWVLEDSRVELAFGVTRSGQISLGVRGELAGDVTQTLALTLALAG